MKNVIRGVLVAALAIGAWQAVAFSQGGAPPNMAFDIAKADIDTLLKNAPPAVDQQLRVVDVGKYNVAVGIIHRGPTNDKPGIRSAGRTTTTPRRFTSSSRDRASSQRAARWSTSGRAPTTTC